MLFILYKLKGLKNTASKNFLSFFVPDFRTIRQATSQSPQFLPPIQTTAVF
jgi:hypothetical protein